jgi:formylglycine-generating enzyme required for sulfatase activity
MKSFLFILLVLASTTALSQEMMDIPSGAFIMGTDKYIFSSSGTSDMLPDSIYKKHEIKLDSFKISKYEINSEIFYNFLIENGESEFDTGDTYEQLLIYNGEEYFDYPAISNYYYAMDFCNWLSEKHNKFYRLPTEAEWEYAATGGKDYNYPWGDIYKALSRCQDIKQRLPYKMYQGDCSPFGIMNMFGNVAEWVLDYYKYNMYNSNPIMNPLAIDGEQLSSDNNYYYPPNYVVRGKNVYFYNAEYLEMPIDSIATVRRRYAYWHKYYARTEKENIGFRIVEDEKNKIFSTTSGNVIFYYKKIMLDKNIDVYLYPTKESKVLVNIPEGSYIMSRYLKIDNNEYWLCVQNINYRNTNVKKMGDESVVGWINLDMRIFF